MNSNTLAICPKCYQVPIFKFSPSEPGKIVIICHCGFNEGIWIKDYLKKIENTPTDKTRFKCEKHNARFGYFCVNCNLHYCQTCHDSAEYKVHNDEYHSVFILNKPKDEMISKFKEGSKKIEEEVPKYLNSTLPEIKNQFKDIFEKNPKIEELYNAAITNNTNIFNFIQLLIKNTNVDYLVYNNCDIDKWNLDFFNLKTFIKDDKKEEGTIEERLSCFFSTLCIVKDKISLKPMKQLKLITEKDQPIFAMRQLKDGRFIYGTLQKLVIINVPNGYKVEQELIGGHDAIISDVSQLANGNIISSDYDGVISIWTLNADGTFKLDKKIDKAHEKKINKILPLTKDRFASSSDDTKIKIWNSKSPYECILTLEGHTARVFPLLQINDDHIISGGKEGAIRKWDLNTGKCVKTLENVLKESDDEELIEGMYYDSFYDLGNGKTLSSAPEEIKIINNENLQIELTTKNDRLWEATSFLEIRKGIFLVGACEGRMSIYNANTNVVEEWENGFGEYVLRMIKINEFTFASVDGFLNFWVC